MPKTAITSNVPDALTLLAVAKCVKEKELIVARGKARVGTHEIDTRVHLRGTLVVNPDVPGGEGHEAPATFPPWVLLSILLKMKRVLSIEDLAETAAMEMKTARAIPEADLIQASFAAQAAKLLPPTHVPGGAGRRGSVSFHGRVELAGK